MRALNYTQRHRLQYKFHFRNKTIGVVGCGWLGRSVAIEISRAQNNFRVKVFDQRFFHKDFSPNLDELKLALSDFQIILSNLKSRRLIDDENQIMKQISLVTHVDDLHDCEIIFECTSENIFSKQQMLCVLDSVAETDSIIASACTTGHTDIISKYTHNPHRILTCIWKLPVYFIPSVSIATTSKNNSVTFAEKLSHFFQEISKTANIVSPCPVERSKQNVVLSYDEALKIQSEYAESRGVKIGKVFGMTFFQRTNKFMEPENEKNHMIKFTEAKLVENVTQAIICVDISSESENFKTFKFSLETSDKKLHVVPGQVCKIRWKIDGNLIERFYAILSPTEISVTIGVQMNIGFVSNWLDKHMKVGAKAELIQTFGNPFLVENPATNFCREKFLFVAGGTGITPLISMMKWLGPRDADLILLYSVKGPEIPFLREILDMEKQFLKFKIIINVTREAPNLPYNFHKGRLSENKIREHVPDIISRMFYVLGPRDFMVSVRDIIRKLASEDYEHFLKTAKTGPDNERPEDAEKCWQPAFAGGGLQSKM